MSVLLAIGVVVALSIVLAVLWYKTSTKLKINRLYVQGDGALTIWTESLPPSVNVAKLNGKKIVVMTRSLGRITSSVCSIIDIGSGPAAIKTAAGAYSGAGAYVADANDYVLISIL